MVESDFVRWSQRIKEFCSERDWDQFHGPKDLAIGLVTEASELLEEFRFWTETQIEEGLKTKEKREAIGDELADVLFFVLRFSQRYQFDLNQCLERKMKKNAERYPALEFKGKNHKSTR